MIKHQIPCPFCQRIMTMNPRFLEPWFKNTALTNTGQSATGKFFVGCGRIWDSKEDGKKCHGVWLYHFSSLSPFPEAAKTTRWLTVVWQWYGNIKSVPRRIQTRFSKLVHGCRAVIWVVIQRCLAPQIQSLTKPVLALESTWSTSSGLVSFIL